MITRSTFSFALIFTTLLALGIFFRFNNISPNKIYPDSYQSLLIAENIETYHSVVGYLGKDGMLYPDFFAWTRPGFPLFILLLSYFHLDLATAAQLITSTASLASLLLAYYLGKKLFDSHLTGLTTMLLLVFSFNHTVWSGFILTEGVAVFLMLLFFCFLLPKPIMTISPQRAILSGIIFTLLIFTRYEYALVLIPVLYYMRISSYYTKNEIIIFLTSFLVTLCIFLYALYPLPVTLLRFFTQSQDLLQKSSIVLALLLLFLLIYNNVTRVQTITKRFLPTIFLWILWLGTFFLLVQLSFPSFLSPMQWITEGLRNFLFDDLILCSCFLIGITIFIRRGIGTPLLSFTLLGGVLLYVVYFRTNPAMERYFTHLIPFLLIPAGYGLAEVIRMGRAHEQYGKLILILMLLSIGFQGVTTLFGIHEWGDKAWFSKSYDEQSAKLLKAKIKDHNDLLLVSFPEPYYLFTGLSTYSISDTYPYVYIPEKLDNRTIIISEDMGMIDIFPNFTSFLDSQMQDKQYDSYFVNLPYHYANYSKRETSPVILYKTTVKELRMRITSFKPVY